MPRSKSFARFVDICYAKRASKRKIVRLRRQSCEHLCPWRLADSQTSRERDSHSFAGASAAFPRSTVRVENPSSIAKVASASAVLSRSSTTRTQTPAGTSANEFLECESDGRIVTGSIGLERACKLSIICLHRSGTVLRKHIRGKSWHSRRLTTGSLALVWSRSSLPAVPFPTQRLRKKPLPKEWRKFAQQQRLPSHPPIWRLRRTVRLQLLVDSQLFNATP